MTKKILLITTLLVFLLSISLVTAQASCQSDGDCTNGLCKAGVCRTFCDEANPTTCDAQESCLAPNGGGQFLCYPTGLLACEQNEDCMENFRCQEVAEDRDADGLGSQLAPTKFFCVDERTNQLPSGYVDNQDDCNDNFDTVVKCLATEECKLGSNNALACVPKASPSCTIDADCAQGSVCIVEGNQASCVKSCSQDTDCASGLTCNSLGTPAKKVCSTVSNSPANPSEKPVACTTNADCNGGLCIDDAQSNKICIPTPYRPNTHKDWNQMEDALVKLAAILLDDVCYVKVKNPAPGEAQVYYYQSATFSKGKHGAALEDPLYCTPSRVQKISALVSLIKGLI